MLLFTYSAAKAPNKDMGWEANEKNLNFYYHPLSKQHMKAQTNNPELPSAKLLIGICKEFQRELECEKK